MTSYLLHANAALALCYAAYCLFVRRDTFIKAHRACLLLSLVLPFVLPLLTLPAVFAGPEAGEEAAAGGGMFLPIVLPAVAALRTTADTAGETGWLAGVGALWATGTAWLLVRFAMQLARLFMLVRRCPAARIGEVCVRILPSGHAPFSFFGLIFLPETCTEAGKAAEILAHERTHARQAHSLDIILAELACACCWVNPCVWLLRREIRTNLEYLADRGVLAAGFAPRAYQYLLLEQTFPTAAATLYNHFHVLLKKRIRMMNQKKTLPVWGAKYLLCLPFAALLAVACSKQPSRQEAPAPDSTPSAAAKAPATAAGSPAPDTQSRQSADEPVYDKVDEKPAFPGGEAKLMQTLSQNLSYPEEAVQSNLEGRVTVQFVVNKEGEVCDVQVLQGVAPVLDEAAVKAVEALPRWIPGKLKGQPVSVMMALPVHFQIK